MSIQTHVYYIKMKCICMKIQTHVYYMYKIEQFIIFIITNSNNKNNINNWTKILK